MAGKSQDIGQCGASVYHSSGNWGQHDQCERKAKQALWGTYREIGLTVNLCTQHAKEAKTRGQVTIVDPDGKKSWHGPTLGEFHTEFDPELAAEAKRKRDEADERYRRSLPSYHTEQVRKQLDELKKEVYGILLNAEMEDADYYTVAIPFQTYINLMAKLKP